jgi:hypothetical protein
VCSGLNAIFWGAKLWSLQSSLFDPKWCLGVFHCISLTLCMLKDAKLVFKPDCTISGYQSCESSVLVQWTQDDVWECFGAYCSSSARKKMKTHVSGLNALFWVTKVVKQPFYSIGPKMIFGCVLEDFAKLRQVKRCKTCVWSWIHYFG